MTGWTGAPTDHTPAAIVVADTTLAGHIAADAIELAGARVLIRAAWDNADSVIGKASSCNILVLEAEGVEDAILERMLPLIEHQARDRHVSVVAAIHRDQIDLVAAHLFGRNVHLLCAADVTDRVTALTIARNMPVDTRWSDNNRDAEAERLRRLNQEVARIAETLARLTRDDGGVPDRPVPAVGDRTLGYGAPPSSGDAGKTVTATHIRQAIRARRLRTQFFEGALFEDSAWDMLLDLYAAELERAQVSVSSLCIAAAVAPTTALRWIAKMSDAGLLMRHPDPFDRRRAFMALSGRAREGLQGYFAAAQRAGLAIA